MIIFFITVLVCVCFVFAVWITFTEKGADIEDWFRKRWGGSDARPLEKDDE